MTDMLLQSQTVEGPARTILDLLERARNRELGHDGGGLSFTELIRYSDIEQDALIRASAWLHHKGLIRRCKNHGRRIFVLSEPHPGSPLAGSPEEDTGQ